MKFAKVSPKFSHHLQRNFARFLHHFKRNFAALRINFNSFSLIFEKKYISCSCFHPIPPKVFATRNVIAFQDIRSEFKHFFCQGKLEKIIIVATVNNCADYSKTELDVSTNFNGFEFYRTAAINSKKKLVKCFSFRKSDEIDFIATQFRNSDLNVYFLN